MGPEGRGVHSPGDWSARFKGTTGLGRDSNGSVSYNLFYFSLRISAAIGLLYPCIDKHLGEPHKFKREWSSVMRCVAVFVGINHASAKVDFDNNIQLSLTLAALSIGLWWTFDRSRTGFGLGVGIAFLATLVTQLLVYNGVYQYTSPDFLYVRSWLPCIFFAGGITMGNIGRQLAMYECKVIAEKSHQE
ncbi:insulin-induced gene 2 protein isoform X2 [Phyllostomus hastatus]|uniref:insulin-induced gene 2 protein isoform X2 n=1 Tax=Phyllostomus hastatus TaxID=9423 RepID=UPI001E682B55|nr:insulin-induced gene 2 protein isoform X2 [Phyllostomus hastatus]